jgi:hypothetical protein
MLRKIRQLQTAGIPTSFVVSMVTYAYPCSVSLDAVIKLTGIQVKEILNKSGNVTFRSVRATTVAVENQ